MKKTKITRLLLRLLSAALALSAFAGCGDKKDPVDTDTETSAFQEETEDLYDAEGYLLDSLPSDLDFGNKTVEILCWNSEVTEFDVDDNDSQVIDRAVWNRNTTTENRLSVNLKFSVTKGDVYHVDDYKTTVLGAELAGSPFDIVAAHTRSIAVCAVSGLLANLGGIEGDYFDFDAPWWNQTIIDQTTVGDSYYYVTGDIAPSLVQMIYCVYFNADMISNFGLESPYDLVDGNEWTLEKMMTMTQDIYMDVNQNEVVDDGDRIPVGGWYFDWPALLHGCNVGMAGHDDTGEMVLDKNLKGVKGLQIMEKLQEWVTLDGCFVTENGNPLQSFLTNNELFFLTMSGRAAMSFSEIGFEYGCVPMPKYNSEQKNYVSAARQPVTLYALQRILPADRIGLSSAVMECLASQGYRDTTPVVFKTVMQYQKSQSPEMSRMLELIRDTAWFDFARIYSYNLDGICDRPGRYLMAGQAWEGYVNGSIPTVELQLEEIVKDLINIAQKK